ncbi:MAG: acyl-CoA dehydrogenase family protein [Thermodesulfobacteriota bacterium]|nr:acyl-CoA dehydrogenase family protein [Thermodesulfobacteriota bacterium]
MISRSDIKAFLGNEPQFDDIMCSLRATGRQPGSIIKEMKAVTAIARKFNEEVARPYAAELDLKMHADADYLAWDFVKKANEWKLYTLFIPKTFGGQGYSLSCMGYFLEELSSVCPSMANLVGVHYLGYAGLTASWNAKLIDRISRDVVRGQKTGEPCLISFAMTEPDAGTDSQNVEFMDIGSLACHAKKVEGGYILNGTKIFISCGHLSTWHTVFAYTDTDRASENMAMMMVRTGSEGFSFGKKEKKMGQKASVASELVFRDCFVPDELVLLDKSQAGRLTRTPRQTTEQILAYIWSASRTGVSAFGVGVARGAYEKALQFAAETEINGEFLINHEWCQAMLAEMYKNVAVGRLSYFESAYASGMHGMWKLLNLKPMYYMIRWTPLAMYDKIFPKIAKLGFTTWLFRKFAFDFQSDAEIDRTDGWGSLAKTVGTDAGITNCRMALEIMGKAGIRHEQLVEKLLRDSKLFQIYEGTNQINRINTFKRLVARNCPGTECFPYPGNDRTC